MIIGKIIDNYKITAVLGKGGMGVVYKATDMTLDRDVALKMMDARLASDENFLKRFQSEAKALARLQNPNIVGIFALRETELGLCIVMEYVEGDTLADRISKDGPMSLAKTLVIFKQLLIAFDHAHKAGIIHRDIKPSNVMLTRDDVVKVTDFGLAKIQQPSAMTATMGTGGTLFYMSPEQIRGLANVDNRGDIYSIGMTLYETLAGKVPFTDTDSDFDIRQAIVEGKIPNPDKINPDIPRDVARVIMKSIEKEPDKRYQTAAEFRDALAGVKVETRHAPAATTIDQGSAPVASRSKEKRTPLLVGIAILILAVAAYQFLLKEPAATLSVNTNPPGARVVVNGNDVGTTPIGKMDVSPGSVALRIDKEGYFTKDTTLVLESGKSFEMSISLMKVQDPATALQQETTPPIQGAGSDRRESRPAGQRQVTATMATLIVRAIPSGSVSVGGKRINSAAQLSSVDVDAGDQTVVFEHPQYGSKRVPVTLKAGEKKTLTCYFESYVSIGVSGDSRWGTIIVDGTSLNMFAPQAKVPLGVGTHRILVSRDGYETVEGERVVTVAAEMKEVVYPLLFTLKKK
ncbi:MAG: serine/threonine protein kinase [Bacteroidota bacterium]